MSLTSTNNVISLTEFAKGRSVSPEVVKEVFQRCRSQALNKLCPMLAAKLDQLNDELFELAEKTLSREKYNRYLNARGVLEAKRSIYESSFRSTLLNSFDQSIKVDSSVARADKPVLDIGELSLVDHADFEQSLAVRQIASLWRKYSADELNAFEARVIHLLSDRQSIGDSSLPLSPMQIAQALDSACDELDVELGVRLLILEALARAFAKDLKQMYAELNAMMIANDVLPKVPLSLKVKKDDGPTIRQPAHSASEASPAAVSKPVPDGMVLISEEDASLLGVLRQLVQTGQMPVTAQSAGLTTKVLPELTKLQLTVQSAPVAALGTSEALSLSLRSLKEGGLVEQVSQIESLTIDIVAMLFDFIFDEENIPAEIKALIGRLQIPVLKAALLDGKFFSRKQHPVRRMLDLLAQLSVGWQSEEYLQRLVTLIEDVVNHILTEFTDEIAVFEVQEARLLAFVEEENRLSEASSERTAKVIIFQEQQMIALEEAKLWVASRLDKHGVPQVVRDFLANHGVAMQMDACLQHGLHTEGWYRSQEVMDQLIWSCEPKITTEDRVKLVGLLQPMLSRIESVLVKQPNGAVIKELFLAELVKCHATAIRQGATAASASGVPQIRTPLASMDIALPVLEEVLAEPFSPIDVPSQLPAVVIEEEVHEKIAERWMQSTLRRGEWVEVELDDSVQQMKLAWISPYKAVYLFTNRFGGNALSVSQEDLNRYLADGKVRRIEASSFSERAVSNVLHRLEEETAQ